MKIRSMMVVVCCLVASGSLYGSLTGCGNDNAQFPLPPQDDPAEVVAQPTENPPPPATQPSTAEYWVSTEGSDDNPGTRELPLRTVAKAAEMTWENPKDIYVFPGTYREAASLFIRNSVSIYGLSSQTADPSQFKTIIDFSSCPDVNCSVAILEPISGKESTIDSLTITGKRIGIVIDNASPVITNNEITTVGGSDIEIGIAVLSANGGNASPHIENNIVSTGEALGASSRTLGIDFEVVQTSTAKPYIVNNVVTAGSSSSLSYGIVGVSGSTSSFQATIADNSIQMSTTGEQSLALSLYGSAGSSAAIERNDIIAGIIDGTSPQRGSIGIAASDMNGALAITNNFVYGGQGGLWSDAMYISDCADTIIYHNSLHAGDPTDSAGGIGLWGTTQAQIRNNIICSDAGVSVGVQEQDMNVVALHNNLFCQNWQVYYAGNPGGVQQSFIDVASINLLGGEYVNNIEGDPSFVDPITFDYHIDEHSDALDVAQEIDGFDLDINMGARPKGNGPDIGAHEYP